ncbi:MAG: Cl-channel, voltage gated [Verrucomicrobiaceae bacterium]|nr:Cl-channel, voltage gated [Verrucomicrobiaceae bacterium]
MQFNQMYRRLRPRLWADRLLVWTGAVVTGLTVVGFVELTDYANGWFAAVRTAHEWAPLLITPIGGALVVWLTQRYAVGAAGSGIPQVIAALNPELPATGRPYLVSLRLTVGKIFLGAAAMFAGFSTGREGPSVQIAAGVFQSFHRWVIHKTIIKERDLILAGGAAGIAAAFNAPLAGIVFAIEELSKRFEERSSGVLITAIVISGLVAVSIMGNLNYFGRVSSVAMGAAILWPGIVVTMATGLLGGLFARLLIHSFRDKSWRINQWRGRHPIGFAALCGLVVAVLGLLSGGEVFGSGYTASQGLLSGQGDVSMFYFVEKFIATWASFWSGVPGGIFAPALAVGAGIGRDVALITSALSAPPVIALGMAGFLAAVTQAPITSFIIVMEMTDEHSMVLSLMAAALLASVISRVISEPLYPALAKLQLTRVETLLSQQR